MGQSFPVIFLSQLLAGRKQTSLLDQHVITAAGGADREGLRLTSDHSHGSRGHANHFMKTAILTNTPGQEEIYFPETSKYVYNRSRRIRPQKK